MFYEALIMYEINNNTHNSFIYKNVLNTNSSVNFSIKLVLLTSALLLMRGGTPRYRYDYLTKLG